MAKYVVNFIEGLLVAMVLWWAYSVVYSLGEIRNQLDLLIRFHKLK